MQNEIKEIIDTIPSKCIFDSHFIIDQIIKNYSDEYINFVSKFAGTSMPTLTAHGSIGKEIAKLKGKKFKQLKALSFSDNVHNNPGKCAAWQKI